MRVRLVSLVALMALVLASCGGFSPDAAGPSEGIQVHGDWTIDIYNEDGSLDEHVEFSNALVALGQESLVELLAAEQSAGRWNFEIGEATTPAQVCPTTGFQGRCFVAPIDIETIDVDQDSRLDTLRLSGSTEIEADGQVEFVRSVLKTCEGSISPSDCASGTGIFRSFTERALDPGDVAAVTAGQVVQVQIEISFTSG